MLGLSKALDPFAAVHILDFSGHGESRWPDEGFSMDIFEQDVLKLMDARDLASAHVFGYSLGGFVGLRLAARLPERINSVTTLATKFDWNEETCIRESSGLDADILEARAPKFAAAMSLDHPRNGWRAVVAETSKLLRHMSSYRFTEESLGAIQVPVRLMVGDGDKMVSITETIEAYHTLPKGELAVLPGTPHPLERVNKSLLAELIRPLLTM